MRFILGIMFAIMPLGGPAIGGYCPPDRLEQRPIWTGDIRPVRDDPQTSNISPYYALITGILMLVAFFLGQSTMMVNKEAVREAIDEVFKKRHGEAVTHSRRKMKRPLDVAYDGVKGALEKLGLWPS